MGARVSRHRPDNGGSFSPGAVPCTSEKATSHRLFALGAALLAVGVGYGALLPLVPTLLAGVMPAASRKATSLHTGTLAAAYMLAIVAVAPGWGAFFDRFGCRGMMVLGLAGHALAVAAVAWATSMQQIYVLRLAAGVSAGAVLVSAFTVASELEGVDRRTAWLAWLGSANLLGFLVGPAISAGVGTLQLGLKAPLLASAGVSVLASAAALAAIGKDRPATATTPVVLLPSPPFAAVTIPLLSGVATFALGAFEVGLTLNSTQGLALRNDRLALLFIECSAVMLLIRAGLALAPALASRFASMTVAVAMAAMAGGFVVLASMEAAASRYLAVMLVAAGSGAALPILTLLASLRPRPTLGAAIGMQTGVAYLGQAAGSAVAGWLYDVAGRGSFWIYALCTFLAAAVSTFSPRWVARLEAK